MNSLKWTGDESVEDLDPRLVQLAEESDEHGLTKELYHALNGHGSAHEFHDDGYEYVGRSFDTDELLIIDFAYRQDARKILEIVHDAES